MSASPGRGSRLSHQSTPMMKTKTKLAALSLALIFAVMPTWAQKVTYFNPIRYFVEVIRMVMLKGAGFNEIINQMGIIALYAFLINGFAVWSYKKTT